MKKIAFCIMTASMLLAVTPLQLKASFVNEPSALVVPKPAESTEANNLLLRLNEISSMEKSKLNSAEKKNLRTEVRATKNKLRDLSGGVYLSAGAIILIVLLLIILL